MRRSPGDPGPDAYSAEYSTTADMAPGPAILRVSLRGECDGNYLDNWVPRTIDLPAVAFDVVASKATP